MTEKTLKISAQLERKLAWHRGQSVRHVVCELEAPGMEREENEQEARINLALVLDNSGSMSGQPLQAAKDTAMAVAELLGPEDMLSLVTFATETEVILHHEQMDSAGKDRARQLISRIQTRGSTNLSGGWFEGAKILSEVMESGEEYVHHLILLSDGYANQGLLDVDVLCGHVTAMRERGMSTSCVGFGDNYEMKWLESMAEAGGGRLHDAEQPEEIAEVLLGELGEVRQTVLEDVRVVIQGAEGVSIELLERYGTMSKPNGLEVILGSLISEAKRKLVFVVTLPSGEVGSEIPLVIQAEYKSAGEEQVIQTDEISLGIELARGADNNRQQRNFELARLIAEHWKTQILHHCMQLNRDRAYREATEYARRQFNFLQRFCQGVAGTEIILRELGFVAERVSYEINERNRKNIQMHSRKTSKNEREYRWAKQSLNMMEELDMDPTLYDRGANPRLPRNNNPQP